MVVKNLKIKLDSKHILYGTLNGSLKDPLIIIVHGLPGSSDEYFHTIAANYFAAHGYSTFRVNLYNWHKGARKLLDCTLQTHAQDLNKVVNYFRQHNVKQIFAIGHSYGGPSIMLSNSNNYKAVSLWDPSYKSTFTKRSYGMAGGKYIREAKGYLMNWGVAVIIGEKMAHEADKLDWDSLAKNFPTPLQIITAGNGILKPGNKHYIQTAQEPKEQVIIAGATHHFNDTDKMEEKVFAHAVRWFKKFS